MNNNSDEYIPNAHPTVQVIGQGDASEMPVPGDRPGRSRFRVVIDADRLAAAPPRELSYFEWSIVTDPTDIDGEKEEDTIMEGVADGEGDAEPESMDNGDEENGPDGIDNVEESGRNLDDQETSQPLWSIILTRTDIRFPAPGSLKGYEYTKFNPTPTNHNSPAIAGPSSHMRPTRHDVLAAMEDLKKILHPSRDAGRGYKDPEIDLWRCARLEGMMSAFHMFTDPQSLTYNQWGSACQTAIGMGRGKHCARRLCELNRGFLDNREVLPLNPYGDWNESLLVDENLVNEISIYLLSLGNDITATKLMHFLHRADIKETYGIERDITHKTACRYLQALGYRYQSMPKGQYVDGHEREDVITYRKQVFLPKWKKFMDQMAAWDKDLKEHLPSPGERKRVIAWFHDESVFYAHDQRKKRMVSQRRQR